MNYKNQHPGDQFMPLINEKNGCLHKQVDGFFKACTKNILGWEVQKIRLFWS
jgi:hypothetical protein